MAKMTVKLPDDMIAKISKLGDRTDEICEKALKAGAEIAEEKVRSNLKSVIGKDLKTDSRSTGELVDALGVTPVGIDKNGNYDVKIGFKEPRKDGSSNAKIANILEYGKVGQPPKPFLKPAQKATKKQSFEKVKAVFDEEVSKL